MKKINVVEAKITTATVEIQTLTINGKQMTLAVFRQLQQEDIFDEEKGRLKGVPWGIVNYFWGDCQPNHLHVVWQKGNELRRACVYEKGRFQKLEKEAQRLAKRHLASLVLVGKSPFNEQDLTHLSRHTGGWFHVSKTAIYLRYSDPIMEVARIKCRQHENLPDMYGLDKMRLEELESKLVGEYDASLDTDRTWSELLEVERQYHEKLEQWERIYKEMADLPQLFIAL